MSGFAPSFETIAKWVKYWHKFKGKRVKVFLRTGLGATTNSQFVGRGKQQPQEQSYDTVTGTIEDVVESPLGILLSDVSMVEEEEVEAVFIPLLEILRIYSFRETGTEYRENSRSRIFK